jgi:hypothetical protein
MTVRLLEELSVTVRPLVQGASSKTSLGVGRYDRPGLRLLADLMLTFLEGSRQTGQVC